MVHTTSQGVSRRRFLYGAAAAAGTATLGACSSDSGGSGRSGGGAGKGGGRKTAGPGDGKGSASEPLKPPASFAEAPSLTEQVKAGKLPAVADRLPETPYVVPHKWARPGKYGGNLILTTPDSADESNKEWMYAHSLLRWLNDGLDIGPGMAQSWESNDDGSEWTLHFRKGLKWSDGHPWTTADVMFWWKDMILNDDWSTGPPDETRSGKGTIMKLSAPDDLTLVLTFDAPTPLTADRLANQTSGPGGHGTYWMMPKHYVTQFHPAYNKSAPKDWASAGGAMETKGSYVRNPECPTMTPWRLAAYHEGQSLIWERNPYCYCVARDGSQLPYLDKLTMNVVQDPEVGKLQIQQGKVDYVHGAFSSITLADVSTMKSAADRAGIDVFFWDSGSGTGSMFFFNYDERDPKLRKLFRNPKFRQALSYAFNRPNVQESVYFKQGELTTGTMSPKSVEYRVNDHGKKVYQQWRDSYVKYDPKRAEKMFDELGLVDRDGDGFRELPDGSKLTIRIDYAADINEEHAKKDDHLVRDWKAVGIHTTKNPISPESYGDQWTAGRLMTHTNWEVSDGPNCLVNPAWLIPIEPSRWAPMEGQYYSVRGTSKEGAEADKDPFDRTPPRMAPEKGGPIEKLWKLYDRSKVEPDEMKRHRLVWQITKIHIDEGPFFMGCVANCPRVVIAKRGLRNVPRASNLALGGYVNTWIYPVPAVYDPELYYWDDPGAHA